MIITKSTILLLFYGYLGLLSGGLQFYEPGGITLLSGLSWKIATALGFCNFLVVNLLKNKPSILNSWQPTLDFIAQVSALSFLILLLSDYPTRNYSFLNESHGIAISILIASAGTLVLRNCRMPRLVESILPFAALLISQTIILYSFYNYVGTKLVFSDDHPSFLYRLILLQQHFPNIPFYNPDWNAGYSAREFFPSGILNIFVLLSPIIYLIGDLKNFEIASYYSYAIPLLFVFTTPYFTYFIVRFLKLNKLTAATAAVLSLAPTFSFFEFLLNYGTISFCLSAALFPLSIVAAYKILLTDDYKKVSSIALAITIGFLGFTWHLMIIALLPIALLALFYFRTTFLSRRIAVIVLVVACVTSLHFPSLKVLYQESNLKHLASQNVLPGSKAHTKTTPHKTSVEKKSTSIFLQIEQSLKSANKMSKILLHKLNPLLFLFGLPGILLIPDRKLRWGVFLTLSWLCLLAIFGDQIKPQFELRRMAIPAGFLATIPTALLCNRLFELAKKNSAKSILNSTNITSLFLAGLAFAGVILAPIASYQAYGNQSHEKFSLAPNYLSDFSDAIRTYGGDGRTFFSGFILHELGAESYDTQDGGHVAALASFSGKPMYASHYYHVRWSTVDPIPPQFRKRGAQGIEEFLDLVNATATVSFKREWAKYFRENPKYKQVYQGDRFRLFTRTPAENGYFLKGSGAVKTTETGIEVTPQSEEIVLKFRHLPKLRILNDSTAKLYPVEAFKEEIAPGRFQDVFFIGISVTDANKNKLIKIGYN